MWFGLSVGRSLCGVFVVVDSRGIAVEVLGEVVVRGCGTDMGFSETFDPASLSMVRDFRNRIDGGGYGEGTCRLDAEESWVLRCESKRFGLIGNVRLQYDEGTKTCSPKKLRIST